MGNTIKKYNYDHNIISCKTFARRWNKCYKFNEKDTYVKQIENLLNNLIETSKNTILYELGQRFSIKKRQGVRYIYPKDREQFLSTCIDYSVRIDNFITKFKLTNIGEKVIHRRLSGNIGGIIPDKNITVYFSFRNNQEGIDIFSLINYIYNQKYNLTNKALVYSLPDDYFFFIDSNYTNINRYLFKSILLNKIKRQGLYCLYCKNTCKPMIVPGIERLELII